MHSDNDPPRSRFRSSQPESVSSILFRVLRDLNSTDAQRERREAYYEYLRSTKWFTLRCEALARDNNRCQHCGTGAGLEVHHLKYPERWGDETVDMLQTLCGHCHYLEHSNEPAEKAI